MVLYAAALAVYRAFAAGAIHDTVEHYKMKPNFFSTLALVVSVPFCVFFHGAFAYTVVLQCVLCAGLAMCNEISQRVVHYISIAFG